MISLKLTVGALASTTNFVRVVVALSWFRLSSTWKVTLPSKVSGTVNPAVPLLTATVPVTAVPEEGVSV